MSWADKAHKKYQVEKLVKKVLSDPEFRKAQQSEDLKAFSGIALISVDFMMRKHGYGKKTDPGVCGIPEKAAGVCDGR